VRARVTIARSTLMPNCASDTEGVAPAERLNDGAEYWMVDGKAHRIDGPAIVNGRFGAKDPWALRGQRMAQAEWEAHPVVVAYRQGVPEDFALHSAEAGITDPAEILRAWREPAPTADR
jgi:hypothetical protein